MHLQPVDLPHMRCPTGNSQGTPPAPYSEVSAWSTTKAKAKITGVSVFSPFFCLVFFFLFCFLFWKIEKKKKIVNSGIQVWFREKTRALGNAVVRRGMGFNVICPFSLIVAALQVFTLNVPSAVVCARELDPIFVHAPADAPFASARWLALWDRTQDCRLDKKKKAWSDHKVAQQNVLLCLCKKKKSHGMVQKWQVNGLRV